jgi:aminopeptidase YwaD
MLKIRKKLLLGAVLFLFFQQLTLAQDLQRVRKTIDTLASASFLGRGYTFNGHELAAKFIAKEFKEIGLKSYEKNYLQTFPIDINTFPTTPQLTIGEQKLIVGKDFIVQPASVGATGKGSIYHLDSAFLYAKNPSIETAISFTDKVLVYESKHEKKVFELPKPLIQRLLQAQCWIKCSPKLTMSLANEAYLPPTFELHSQYLPQLKDGMDVTFALENQLLEKLTTQNVVAYKKGKQKPDSVLVFSAHYDHLGTLGKEAIFYGANDNASGISMLLELARYYTVNPSPYTVVFIAFGAEEAGLLGSKYFVKNPPFDLSKIKLLVNLDLVGTGDDGLGIVNATVFPQQFAVFDRINQEKKYFSKFIKRGKAANSDHYFFTEKGVPSFFIYGLGGIQAYHDTDDKAATLPLTKYKEIFSIITEWVQQLTPKK